MQTFTKQPNETLDYDFDYSDFMPDGDSLSASTVIADSGITLGTKVLNTQASVVKQFVSGGTDGGKYKITCRATTTGGRIKELEMLLKVKEL